MTSVRVRPSRGRRTATALAAAVIATSGIALAMATPTASAAKPTAAVAMGDSFISGEGAGNYLPVIDVNGRSRVFGGWKENNASAFYCHRSPNAEVAIASLPGINARFNIACSGAQPSDIANSPLNRPSGLTPGREVASQLDQLRQISKTHDIDLVVVNIGANHSLVNFGFATVACMGAFAADAYLSWAIDVFSRTEPSAVCRGTMPDNASFAQAQLDVDDAVRSILQTLGQIDEDGQHRVVLQDYIDPFPTRFDSNYLKSGNVTERSPRFRQLLWKRYGGGCPVHERTLGPANTMTQRLGTMVEKSANAMRNEFPKAEVTYLNVQAAFDGVKLCEKWGDLTFNLHTPVRVQRYPTGHVRNSIKGFKASEMQQAAETCFNYPQTCQESLHPNAAGHKVLATCLSEAVRLANTKAACARNRASGAIGVTSNGSPLGGTPPAPTTTTTTPPQKPPPPPPPNPDCDPKNGMPTAARPKGGSGLLATIGLAPVGYSQVVSRRVERQPIGC